MEFLKSMGLDPEKLGEEEIKKLNQVGEEFKASMEGNGRVDRDRLIAQMKKAGLDLKKLVRKMRGDIVTKKSTKVGRNEKCPCGSGKKYKKCCLY